LVIAYFCWTNRKSGFLAAAVLALITAIGAYPYPQPFRTVDTPFGAEVDGSVILGSLLIALFGTRAYREARAKIILHKHEKAFILNGSTKIGEKSHDL
jgi:hypothetical protein